MLNEAQKKQNLSILLVVIIVLENTINVNLKMYSFDYYNHLSFYQTNYSINQKQKNIDLKYKKYCYRFSRKYLLSVNMWVEKTYSSNDFLHILQ